MITRLQILLPAKSLTGMGPAAAQLGLLMRHRETAVQFGLAQVPFALAPALKNEQLIISKPFVHLDDPRACRLI